MEEILIYRFYNGLYITTESRDAVYSEKILRTMSIVHPPEKFKNFNSISVNDLNPLEGVSILAEGNSESVRLLLCRHMCNLIVAGAHIVFLIRGIEKEYVSRWMKLSGTCFRMNKNKGTKFLYDVVYSKNNKPFRGGVCPLSEKEAAILECLLLGYNQKEASELMCRSMKTLSAQKVSARMKLRAENDFTLLFNYIEMTRSLEKYFTPLN